MKHYLLAAAVCFLGIIVGPAGASAALCSTGGIPSSSVYSNYNQIYFDGLLPLADGDTVIIGTSSVIGGDDNIFACRIQASGTRSIHIAKFASSGNLAGDALTDDTFITFDAQDVTFDVIDAGSTFTCLPYQPPFYMTTMTALDYSGYRFGMYGLNGDDEMDGGSGRDELCGGRGNDRLSGSDGNDTLDGFDNDDFLFGESGTDIYFGGNNSDVLFDPDLDSSSYETMYGEAGSDCLEMHEAYGYQNCGSDYDYNYDPGVTDVGCEDNRPYLFCSTF